MLLDKIIKLKHCKGKLKQGDEAKVIDYTDNSYLVQTKDNRKEWLLRNEFILVECFTEPNKTEPTYFLSKQILDLFKKRGFTINTGNGILLNDDFSKITILSRQMKVYHWIDGQWVLYYTFTGYENLSFESFKQVMKAFDVIGEWNQRNENFKSVIDIAHETYMNNQG